jgi:hypothetical protein
VDLTDTIAPKSDQANADDFVSGPRTFTITEVRKTGTDDQPVAVYLAEFPADRPFKPSLSMRRVMVVAWGRDASTYVGKRLTLFRDPNVKWGGQAVGGIRISHMSDLKKPLTIALTETRGKRAPFTVQPLADAPAPARAKQPTVEELIVDAERAVTNDELNRIARTAAAATLTKAELGAVREVVTARRADLQAAES